MKTKCMSCGGTMKKMQKGGSTKKKPLLKNPSQGFIKDLNTRLQATLTKMRESPGSAGPFVGDGNQSMLKKEHREMWEQKNLNQDLKLHLYKKQQARLEKEKKIAEKNKMLKLQNKKGSYSKQGFKVGGMTKMQNGGITKDGQKIKFPPIVKKEAIQESVPTKKTAFEKRQDKKIAKAKTRAAVASIEGEGSVKDKRNSRANRIATVVGTGRQKVSRTSSTSTTSNTNSGNTNVSSGSDSGSTSGSRSTSGSTSGVSESGNSKNANETNNNSKNKRYQNGGTTSANFPKSAKYEKYTIDRILKKDVIKRPTPKKPTVTKSSSSVVIGSGNSRNNNSVNNNSNNKKIVITKKDNSVNKSTNSRNRYQKGGSTSSVIRSGNSNNRNTVNNNSNNTKIYKKKVDNSVNKSTGSRNTRIEKAKQKNVKVDRNRPIGGTYPFTFK